MTVEFYWGTNLDVASSDIQQSLNQIIDHLPEDAKQPVIYKFDPSQIPVLTSPSPVRWMNFGSGNSAEDFIAPRLESLKGVASANVWGGRVREIQVEVDRAKLEGMNLSLDKVAAGRKIGPYGHSREEASKTAQKNYGVRTLGRTAEIKRY